MLTTQRGRRTHRVAHSSVFSEIVWFWVDDGKAENCSVDRLYADTTPNLARLQPELAHLDLELRQPFYP